MKRICSTCKHETGILNCIAKHTRWKNARFEIVTVINCQDWQRKNGKREVNDVSISQMVEVETL